MTPVTLVRHGRPARRALEEFVAHRQAEDPLAPVTVAVPSTYAGLSLRAGFEAAINVRFLAIARVAELLGAPFLAAPGTVPRSAEAVREAMRRALLDEPGVFASVARHPSTVRALVTASAELRGLRTGALDALAHTSARAASVVALHRRALANLPSTYDDEDQLVAAARQIETHGIPGDLGALVVHLPVTMSEGAQALFEAWHSRGDAAAILGLTGDPRADLPTQELAAALAARIAPDPGPDPVPDALGPVPGEDPPTVRLRRAPDPDTEVRAVVRDLAAQASAGQPLHRCAITYRLAEPYARLVHQRLADAGIPAHGPPVLRIADTVPGRAVQHLLDLADGELDRGAVMAFVADVPVIDGAHARVPSARWDTLTRRAGIVGGLDQWQERLEAARRDAQQWADAHPPPTDGDEPPEPSRGGAERSGRAAELARIAAFVTELADGLAELDAAGSWASLVARTRRLLIRVLGPPTDRWNPRDATAWELLEDRLGALGALDDGRVVDPLTFRAALTDELDTTLGHLGRFGDGVLVAPLGALRGCEYHTVFVLGMAEGRFPPSTRDDPLLPDRERVAHGLPTRDVTRARERSDHLVAQAAALDTVVCSWPSSDPVAQQALLPAPAAVEIARSAALPGGAGAASVLTAADLATASSDPEHRFEVVDSFARLVAAPADTAGSLAEHRLAVLAHHPDLAASPLVVGDLVLGPGLAMIAARSSGALTEYDGIVGRRDHGTQLPPLSPSRIEAWANCPFQYFLANRLDLRAQDRPEELDTIDRRERGSLVHRILERFVTEHLDRAPDAPWTAVDRARLRELTDEALASVEDQGLTGRPLIWKLERQRIAREVDRALDADEIIRARRREAPIGCEISFGERDGDSWPLLTVALPSGRSVSFHGQIDRVDAAPDASHLTVYDYKTGSNADMRDLDQDPVAAGTRLQLTVYAHAAAAQHPGANVRAAYWHTREPVGGELTEFALDDGLRARFIEVLDIVTDGIEAGAFPADPGAEDDFFGTWENCRWCDFDRVCRPDRGREAERKQDDPRRAPLQQLRAPRGDDRR